MSYKIINKVEYKVKDLSLSDWGRKEIKLAEAEMPGLMSLRKEHSRGGPGGQFSRQAARRLARSPPAGPSALPCLGRAADDPVRSGPV